MLLSVCFLGFVLIAAAEPKLTHILHFLIVLPGTQLLLSTQKEDVQVPWCVPFNISNLLSALRQSLVRECLPAFKDHHKSYKHQSLAKRYLNPVAKYHLCSLRDIFFFSAFSKGFQNGSDGRQMGNLTLSRKHGFSATMDVAVPSSQLAALDGLFTPGSRAVHSAQS